MKNAKAIVLVLCAILLFSACSSSSEETQEELLRRTYKEAYDKGYNRAVSQIEENIKEYVSCVVDEAFEYSNSWGEDTYHVVMPYLYGEEYGEYNEEDLREVVESLMLFYEFFEEPGNYGEVFEEWHDGRFDKDYY